MLASDRVDVQLMARETKHWSSSRKPKLIPVQVLVITPMLWRTMSAPVSDH